MEEQNNKAAYTTGRILGFVIVGGIFFVLWPWAAFNAINGLFNTSIENGFVNYFWFWVLYVVTRSGLSGFTR